MTTIDDYLHDHVMEASAGRTLADCWEWQGTRSRKGYPVFMADYQQRTATRLLLGIEDLDGHEYQACHTCDNPPCVNPCHLFVGSIGDNQTDKGRKGRAARGVDNGGGTKMTPEIVKEARRRIDAGEPTKTVAADYDVSDVALRNAYNRKTWKWVE